MQAEKKNKGGNPAWQKGVSGNPKGRPTKAEQERRTNKELRSEEFLGLVRKFKPHLTKAIQAAVKILEADDSTEAGRLRASALIISTYKELIKDLYDPRYDDEGAEEIQQNSAPVFSLRMIDSDK